MKKIFLLVFAIATVFELVGILLEWPTRVFSKPILMLSLLGYYYQFKEARNNVFVIALIFAWLGDLFMMVTLEWGFAAGLLSFLIMQFCYCFVFYRQTSLWLKNDTLFAIFIAVYVIVILGFLLPKAGEMKIPVLIYGLTFGAVAMMAFWRHKGFKGWSKVISGVMLFVVSDTIIAINKFVIAVPIADFWIMATYILGQYLIVEGYIRSRVS